MDFIFMLTQHDRTVDDCIDVLQEMAPLGVQHIGFKDVGAELNTLKALNQAIKMLGATSYMEVVSTSDPVCNESIRNAIDIGVDRLLGGTRVDQAKHVLKGSGVEYFPFPGSPRGHPTRLYGNTDDIRADCAQFMESGFAGADLLAFRSEDADPMALVQAAREGLGNGYLIVAGSVNSPERIRALANAGADAFTMGSAIFERSFSPGKNSLREQVADVLAACG